MPTSGGETIGLALTSGVQDISALLPLLGTEQCEDHIASALTDGYFHAAATPLSIFGSLGAARVGFNALVSAMTFPGIPGAKILADAGFKPQGKNLSLIMFEEDRNCYCAEQRLASMMTDLNLEDSNVISISSNCQKWHLQMTVVTSLFCIVSITPYIHLNLRPNTLTQFVRWAFPVIKAIGGFLTATMIQLVIQARVLMIMRKRLILDSLREGELGRLGIDETAKTSPWVRFSALDQRCSLLEKQVKQKLDIIDLEEGGGWNTGVFQDRNKSTDRERLEDLRTRIIEANSNPYLKWTFRFLLIIGIIALIVGYVGCFTAVQGSKSSTEALIWLCLEAGLSVIRIIIWGLNLDGDCDKPPPLEFTIKLKKYALLPTCTRPAEEIEATDILPLVRARDFLKAITSYAGLVTRFRYPTLSLYYTLTRRNDATPELSKRVLYITIFDHMERTTRVYSEDWNTTSSEPTYFYSADELTVDLLHGILTTKIGRPIQQYDPIARNPKLQVALAEHYRSILRQVNSGLGHHHPDHDTVKNEWTLRSGEKKSEMQIFGEQPKTSGDGDTLGNGDFTHRTRDHVYLEQRRVEQKVRGLIRNRGQHIEVYMDWAQAVTDNDLLMVKMRNSEVATVEEIFAVQTILMTERREMELMLVDEVREWEAKSNECRRDAAARLFSAYEVDEETGAQLARRWRTDLWERLNDGELAMKARINAAESNILKRAMDAKLDEVRLKRIWAQHTSAIQAAWSWRPLFTDPRESVATPTPSRRPTSRLEKALAEQAFPRCGDEKARRRCEERVQKMAIRLRQEVDGVEARLESGWEHCEFRSRQELVQLTHSDSKWLRIDAIDEDVIKALRNKDFIHLTISVKSSTTDADITRFFANFKSTSCTSIHFLGVDGIPDSVLDKLLPNILSITGPQRPLEALDAAVEQNRSQLEGSRKTTFEFANMWVNLNASFNSLSVAAMGRGCHPSFTLRFFGPESSDQLTLQVIHRCSEASACLCVEPFTFPITPSSEFGLQNITIGNNRKYSSGLTFEPSRRNTFTFILPFTFKYSILDVELLDNYGNRYDGEVTSDSDQDNDSKPEGKDVKST